MSFPIRRFELDPTGINPANYVRSEQHTLGPSRGPFHAIAPYYGPFYNNRDSWKVYKNGVEMVYGVDYFGVVMCSDDTMLFNGEIDEVFLVKGCSDGDIISHDYQVLGGLYQNYSKGIADLWNAFIDDTRPIDWAGVLNKPVSWNPAYHLHMIDDVIGWQPVIIALERLTNAIILKNVPAFEALIDWVLSRVPDIVSIPEIANMEDVGKLVSFKRLLYAMRALNFNAVTFRPNKVVYKQLETIRMSISSTNFPREQLLYWDILYETALPEMFSRRSGAVLVEDNEGSFYIDFARGYEGQDEVTFRVNLRRNNATGPIIAESKQLTLQFNPVWDWDYGQLAFGTWDVIPSERSVLSVPSAEANFLVPGDYFWKGFETT